MPKVKYTKNIIIVTDSQPDDNVTLAQGNLAAKVGAQEIYALDKLPQFAEGHFDGARIYLHGHGDWWGASMGGSMPETIARKFDECNVQGAKVISITGCNTARGHGCGNAVNALWQEMEPAYYQSGEAVTPSRLPGIDSHNLYSRPDYRFVGKMELDSRIVDEARRLIRDRNAAEGDEGQSGIDTRKEAAELCIGSFAQRFHKALQDMDIDAPVHARLLPVSIEATGDSAVAHKLVTINVEDDFDGEINVVPVTKHHQERTKIRIETAPTADGGINGQSFSYVDYGALARQDAVAAGKAAAPALADPS